MIEKYPTIRLHKGATSVVDFDLTEFIFQGGFVMFTIKDDKNNIIKQQELNVQGINQIVFTDEFTSTMKVGKSSYKYDLMWHIQEERFPQCLPSDIDVLATVGGME